MLLVRQKTFPPSSFIYAYTLLLQASLYLIAKAAKVSAIGGGGC